MKKFGMMIGTMWYNYINRDLIKISGILVTIEVICEALSGSVIAMKCYREIYNVIELMLVINTIIWIIKTVRSRINKK